MMTTVDSSNHEMREPHRKRSSRMPFLSVTCFTLVPPHLWHRHALSMCVLSLTSIFQHAGCTEQWVTRVIKSSGSKLTKTWAHTLAASLAEVTELTHQELSPDTDIQHMTVLIILEKKISFISLLLHFLIVSEENLWPIYQNKLVAIIFKMLADIYRNIDEHKIQLLIYNKAQQTFSKQQ